MGLSLFLERKVIRTVVGGILSNLVIKRRRNTLFFEEILANYVKECEKQGYSKEIEDIGREWGAILIKQLMPDAMKKIPMAAMNVAMRSIWISYGILDDINLYKKNSSLILKVKNEGITRIVGQNCLIRGAYEGVLGILFNSELETVKSVQTKESSDYEFKIKKEVFDVSGKDRQTYIKLNEIPEEHIGFDLRSALKSKVFRLKNNNIYFRGKSLPTIEYTLIHLISSRNLLLDKVPYISYDYFREIIVETTTEEEKLTLIKNLLQAMGLGVIKIMIERDRIFLELKYPPYGLQKEEDNWNFLIQVILGYVWTLDKGFKISNVKESYKNIGITFSQ